MMHSREKLKQYASKPFTARGLPPGARLGFDDFSQVLTEFLQEVEMSVPQTAQIQALFDKHRRGHDGIDVEGYEELLFRLLCFLRSTVEVRVDSSDQSPDKGQEGGGKWRQELLRKNPLRFDEVYELGKQLGKGSFGTCYMVQHKTQRDGAQPRQRVCKIISKTKASKSKASHAQVREEFEVLKQLDHPHVLRIFEDFEDDENFYLLMEVCHGGDLQGFLKRLPPMDAESYERWAGKVMQHTLSAVAYCHARGVIHKDLKPENVMLSTPRDTAVQDMHVVVVDFGLAEIFENPTDRSSVISGTPPYMAPEVWQGNFSKSCDIWSIGCMLFFLLSGRLPFIANTIKDFPRAVQQEPDWDLMGNASAEAHSICQWMLRKAEGLRPPATQALRHDWFAKLGLDAGNAKAMDALKQDQIESLLSVTKQTGFEKFLTRFVATQVDASQQKSANEAFRAFDADGDGLLSRDELRVALSSYGASPDVVERVVDELDISKTGQVSYTAFLAGVINLRGKTPEEQDKLLSIAWEQFYPDANGRVKASAIRDGLAARGVTVADLPEAFLTALNDKSGSDFTFAAFKDLLLKDDSGQLVRTLTGEKNR